jgi:hypothetical protein
VVKAVDTFRMRLVMLMIAFGLIVPIVPAAGGECRSCAAPETTACDTVERPADGCCSAREAPAGEEPVDEDDDGCGSCPDGCDSICCGNAMTVLVMLRPAPPRVSIMASAASVVWLTTVSPQDADRELLRPPQT